MVAPPQQEGTDTESGGHRQGQTDAHLGSDRCRQVGPFLVAPSRTAGQLVRRSSYSPDRLVSDLSEVIADPVANIEAAHIYTLNQLESSEAWLQNWLAGGDH